MKKKYISIVNASEHNLKNITLNIPRNAISVITGISGSGKSSLAFDTIYAEGNRRYVESMSSYARQFIDAIKKPDAESIEGLSPSLAINQKTISHNPRSTVGTMTEIYDYLRLLYAKVGDPFCHKCSNPIKARTASDIAKEYCSKTAGTKLTISSPIVRGKKGEYSKLLQKLLADGFTKISIDGKIKDLDDDIKIDKNKTHNIELIIDKIVTNENCIQRMMDSVSLSMKLSGGIVKILIDGEKQEHILSDKYSCLECGISYADIEPRIFSFNSPYGACPECAGIGKIEKDEDNFIICPTCNGTRLKKESLSIKIDKHSIHDLSSMSMSSLKKVLLDLNIPQNKKIISDTIIKEITERLDFINDVGLGYLTLNRTSSTLSGGEAQRVRLATQLGSGLTGVIYVLDEPSIGLHPSDNDKLIASLKRLKDKSNTVIIVEHDEDTIRSADHIIDLGPGAGVHGGNLIAEGTIKDIMANNKSLTGLYLSSNLQIPTPKQRKKSEQGFIKITNVKTNNLKNISVSFPIGVMTTVTGVSGSGKSSLIIDTVCPCISAMINKLNKKNDTCNITGIDNIDRIIHVDQSPIGQTPRSNPATYTDIFNQIRILFAQLPDSKVRSYGAGRFSFNVAGGRCEACEGQGMTRIEMKFMPDVFVTCDSCGGAKFNKDTLEIKYKNKNIAEVLDMTVEEAMIFFKNIPILHSKIRTLYDVGLAYIKLGQSSTTLSGGEAQRIKLAKELSKRSTGKTLYVLDEPTTGLHFDDIKKLINVLHKLRDQGNTIIVIEHNLEVIKTSDYIIDLGPEGGEKGGYIVATGTPEDIITEENSLTGKYLKQKLRGENNVRHI